MKQFNLDEYLKDTSKKVVTREGKPVKIHCTNFASDNPVIATMGDDEYSYSFSRDGKFIKDIDESDYDLFFAPERHEGWTNIFTDDFNVNCVGPKIFTTKEGAEKQGREWNCYVTTIKIEWEE